jgi:hypothetical protein
MERVTKAVRALVVILIGAAMWSCDAGEIVSDAMVDASEAMLDAGGVLRDAAGDARDASNGVDAQVTPESDAFAVEITCDIERALTRSVDVRNWVPDRDTEERVTFWYAELRDPRVEDRTAISNLFVVGCGPTLTATNGLCTPRPDLGDGDDVVSCAGEPALPLLPCRPLSGNLIRIGTDGGGSGYLQTIEVDNGVVRVLCGAQREQRTEVSDGVWGEWAQTPITHDRFTSVRVNVAIAPP